MVMTIFRFEVSSSNPGQACFLHTLKNLDLYSLSISENLLGEYDF